MNRSVAPAAAAFPLALALHLMLQACAMGKDAPRPNIIIMMADDMGYSDLGCYGAEIDTPNIDRLASNGLRFTQFYNTGRCCPTRASLLTGLYPHQAGVGHMTGDYGVPSYQGYLNDRCLTIAEALQPAGYRTLMVGKWHVGSKRPHWPTDRGFDRFYGCPQGGGFYFRHRPGRQLVLGDKDEPLGDDFYVTDAFTTRAIGFIKEAVADGKPFFLYVAHIAPHWPLKARARDIAKYRGRYRIGWDEIRKARYKRQLDLGVIDSRWPLTARDKTSIPWEEETQKDQMDLRMAVYAAQIDSIDQNVGRLMAALKETGVYDNTLFLFLMDNGGCAEGGRRGFNRKPQAKVGTADSFASYGLSWANASNTPFRRYKHWVHEGGIATPLVAHWPAGIQRRGAIEHQPGHVIDLMTTCVDLAGADYPQTRNGKPITPMEGKSLAPAFRGNTIEREAIYWEHEGNRAVRMGKWKLVAVHKGPWELYDMEADRVETKDLAVQHPAIAKTMKAKYAAWADRAGVKPWPVRKKGKKGGAKRKRGAK